MLSQIEQDMENYRKYKMGFIPSKKIVRYHHLSNGTTYIKRLKTNIVQEPQAAPDMPQTSTLKDDKTMSVPWRSQ